MSDPPLTPRIAFVKTPVWDRAEPATQEALGELTDFLGAQCETHDLPESAAQAWVWLRTIMEAEMAFNLSIEWERGREQLSASLRGQLERGRLISALDHQQAVARIARLNQGFEDLFDRYDAILTPSTCGTAPGCETTGDPVFNTLWTLCGMPALNLPIMTGENGLPLGVQLVGQRGADARLLRTARWLVAQAAMA